MAIDPPALRFLLDARRAGADFTAMLCLGRQQLWLSRRELERAFADYGDRLSRVQLEDSLSDPDPRGRESAGSPMGRIADSVLGHLGAQSVDSLDASEFEGASVIADFNEPLDPSLEERYSVVFDGGTREHVFDAATSLRNCMRAVARGGHFLAVSPWDGHGVHGFYQFTPEFYYRALDRRSGFEIERLLASDGRRWWEVTDPAVLGRRIRSAAFIRPTYLYVRARRVEITAPLRELPQQSDYAAEWQGRASAVAPPQGRIVGTAKRVMRPLPFDDEALRRRVRVASSSLGQRLSGRPSADRHAFRRVKL